mmetsp:Transcript_3738/g.9677  ORF Transcript_3738/g.9677 Transcript_3738/m.9677 type:complete len:544 (-) Transcript_3738:7-1638(-)
MAALIRTASAASASPALGTAHVKSTRHRWAKPLTGAVARATDSLARSDSKPRATAPPSLPVPRDANEDLSGLERRFCTCLGGPAAAEKMCDRVTGTPTPVTCGERSKMALAMLQACARQGDVMRTHAWLDRRLEMAGVAVGVRFFNAALLACARAADVAYAEWCLLDMITRGVDPNIFSFNTLLGACAEAADVMAAQKWFDRVVDAHLSPDAATYRTMMAVSARAGNAALAEEWLTRMRDASHPPDALAFSTVVHAWAAAGNAEAAERWLERMHADGLTVDRAVFEVIISAWTRSPQQSVREPLANGEEPSTYGRPKRLRAAPAPSAAPGMVGMTEVDRLGRAETWLWRALEAGVAPTDTTILALVGALARNDDREAAKRILAAREKLGRPPSTAAFAALAWPDAAAGDYVAVEAALADLRQARVQPDGRCLRTLLAAYARAPRPPKAHAEECFLRLRALGTKEVQSEEVLENLRLAVGWRRREELCTSVGFSLPPRPADFGRSRRNHVVGRCMAIEPCSDAWTDVSSDHVSVAGFARQSRVG